MNLGWVWWWRSLWAVCEHVGGSYCGSGCETTGTAVRIDVTTLTMVGASPSQLLYQHDCCGEEANDDDDDDDASSDDAENRWNVLQTVNRTALALLELRGDMMTPALQQHLLPFASKWLQEQEQEDTGDTRALAASLTLHAHLISFSTSPEDASALTSAISSTVAWVLKDNESIEDEELRKAAAHAMEVVGARGSVGAGGGTS